MSAAGVISPIDLSSDVLLRDYLSMTLMTVLLVVFVAQAITKETDIIGSGTISRRVGALFLVGYIVYKFGEQTKKIVDKYFNIITIIIIILITLYFII